MASDPSEKVAVDRNLRDEELEAMIEWLDLKLRRSEMNGEPIVFSTARSKVIFEKALAIRMGYAPRRRKCYGTMGMISSRQ